MTQNTVKYKKKTLAIYGAKTVCDNTMEIKQSHRNKEQNSFSAEKVIHFGGFV